MTVKGVFWYLRFNQTHYLKTITITPFTILIGIPFYSSCIANGSVSICIWLRVTFTWIIDETLMANQRLVYDENTFIFVFVRISTFQCEGLSPFKCFFIEIDSHKWVANSRVKADSFHRSLSSWSTWQGHSQKETYEWGNVHEKRMNVYDDNRQQKRKKWLRQVSRLTCF